MVLFCFQSPHSAFFRIGQLSSVELDDELLDPVSGILLNQAPSPPRPRRPGLLCGDAAWQRADREHHTGGWQAVTVPCTRGPPGEAALRDPVPEAEMMSTAGGMHVRSKLLCAAWEGQARGPWWPGGGHLRVLGPWTWWCPFSCPCFGG